MLPVMDAPQSCGYHTNLLRKTLTIPFTGCNVKSELILAKLKSWISFTFVPWISLCFAGLNSSRVTPTLCSCCTWIELVRHWWLLHLVRDVLWIWTRGSLTVVPYRRPTPASAPAPPARRCKPSSPWTQTLLNVDSLLVLHII